MKKPETNMKRPWISALLNFFFSGLGYIYNGNRNLFGILLTIASLGLSYLEQFHTFSDGKSLESHDSTAFGVLFASIFIANTGLALDAFKEAIKINKSQ